MLAVDLVRALALFGMFVTNLGLYMEWVEAGVPEWLAEIPLGRSAATFAILAGFSLALLARQPAVKSRRSRRQAKVKIAVRAVLLMLLGTALVAAGATIPLILIFYGVFFLLALPFLRLGARGLTVAAAVVTLLGPLAIRYLTFIIPAEWLSRLFEDDPIVRLGELFARGFGGILTGDPVFSGSHGAAFVGYELTALLLYGYYPAAAFMAYLLAGMALGRLNLASRANRIRLMIIGPALMAGGYGFPWLLSRWAELPEQTFDYDTGEGWLELLDFSAHSHTTFELTGNIGVAVTLLVVATVLLERVRGLRRVLAPVIAAGTMTLTVYTAQAIGFALLEEGTSIQWLPQTTAEIFVWFTLGSIGFAYAWSALFRRGPLEYLLYRASAVAKLVR